jgi:DUF4097 and DUF4098 domain-containing protein YvlB
MRSIYRLAAPLALAVSGAAFADEDFQKTVPADPHGVVDISNVSGRIDVSGWDRPEVAVHAELGSGVQRVDVTSEGHRTVVKVVLPNFSTHGSSADLKVQIPRDSELDISAVSADISGAGVQGAQHLNTVSGEITTEIADARAEVKTVSGDVRLKARGQKAPLHVTTVSGDMHLDHVGGDLELGSVSGTITASLDGAHSLRAHSTSGDQRLEGSMQSGSSVEATTVTGDLTVRAAIDGGFRYEVSTFSGDINNCFNEHSERTSHYGPGKTLQGTRGDGKGDVRLKTMSGDVELCDRK